MGAAEFGEKWLAMVARRSNMQADQLDQAINGASNIGSEERAKVLKLMADNGNAKNRDEVGSTSSSEEERQ